MMILLTGGSGGGKSFCGESLCLRFPGPRFYVAAMRPYKADSPMRIARHQAARAEKGIRTVERYTDLAGLRMPERGTALLECICNLTANEMFDQAGNMRDPCGAVLEGVAALDRQCDRLIVVTNDVGSGSGAYSAGTQAYIRALGRINAALARRADAVYELVCGIPVPLKGEPLENGMTGYGGGRNGMILIIGGEGSGKRTFAGTLGYGKASIADGVLDERSGICHVERLVFRDPGCVEALLPVLARKDVVICNESGSGVIPADPEETAGREAVGRLCILLAQQAGCVVRMVSGLPQVLKGHLPDRDIEI